MKKRFTSVLMGFGALCLAATATAQEGAWRAPDLAPAAGPSMNVLLAPDAATDFAAPTPLGANALKLHETPAAPLATSDASAATTRRAPSRAIAADASIDGYYVATYKSLIDTRDGGNNMKVVADAEGDSLTINGFYSGYSVRAHLDRATSTVTIPPQLLYTHATYGAVWLASTADGTPDYTTKLTGTIADDGTIDLTSAWWGIFVKGGDYDSQYFGIYYSLMLEKPNGTMTYVSGDNQYGYYVVISQTSANILTVTNIFNRGLKIEILLNRDRTASIEQQVGLINSSGSWVLIACTSFNEETGNLTGYRTTITTDAAAADNNNKLTWTDWSLLCAEANSYAGHLTNAVLTADTPWAYPTLAVSDFEGEGTEESPYLISSLDHLILLADKVNTDEDHPGTYYNNTYSRTYLGKHFAITADIDMTGYRFDPIGYNFSQRFAGTLDGRGHTLTGLTVKGGTSYYAGLFGMCDTLSVLKNIVLESPTVEADYYYAGALVAATQGAVKNITVNNPRVTASRYVGGGVVGAAGRTAPIDNCHVSGGTITGGGYVGGVAGEALGGITNCSAVGTTVYGSGSSGPIGGVAGNINTGAGENLAFSGRVTYLDCYDAQYMGGVAGQVYNATLKSSFSAGIVRGYSNESYVGGVVGRLAGNLLDCYSSGNIHCYSRMTGGIAGYVQAYTVDDATVQSSLTNCYTSATVECETYQYNRENCAEVVGKIVDETEPVLTNVYADRKVTNFYSTRFGSTTSELTSANGPAGFSSDIWIFTAGAYPRIKAIADTEAAMFSASALDVADSDSYKKISNNTPITALGQTKFYIAKGNYLYTEGHYSKVLDNNTLEIGADFGVDTLYVVNGSVQTYHFINIAPIPFEGDGTAEAPLLIKTKSDMIALSEATTVKHQMFEGMHFLMTNDIDMEYDAAFDGINADPTTAGTSCHFQGVFDGGGHTISRLTLAPRIGWKTEPTATDKGTLDTSLGRSYAGLFGRLGTDGIVRNVNIAADAKFEFYGSSGAIVGYCYGTVENCRNYSDVLGYSCWIGGIAGYVLKGGKIIDCYNAGNVTTSYMSVGGIAGTCYGTVENCANTGNINAVSLITNYSTTLNTAGGIIGGGVGSILRNCVNYGTVNATLNKVGGISGSMPGTSSSGDGKDDIYSCLNLGNAYCGNAANLGAIAGVKGSEHVESVYFDAQMIGLKAANNSDVEGMTGLETSQLISGTPLEGLSTDLWDFTAGQYPTLKKYADEPKVAAARKVLATVAAGETVADLHTDVALGDGASWSLVAATDFKLDEGKLIVLKDVSQVVADTLVAVNAAGVRRPILVQCLPAMPLAGEGTAEAPYLVNNIADWTALANYIDATGNALEEKFVKLTADLDFTDATLARIGADGVTAFAATFDGDGHTIKGITLTPTANSNCAIFGTVAATGAVKNLVVEGAVNAAYTFAAPVVDKLYGALANIESKVSVATTKASAAGVVGNAYEGATLDNVVFSGTVSSNQTSIGGLVATSAAGVAYRNCRFTGKLEQTGTYTAAKAITMGGLVASCGAATFDDCVSDGEITVASEAWCTTIAGFIGMASGAKDNGLYTFNRCHNATPITAGGILAGFLCSTSTAANAQYVMTDCYNTADIIAASTKAISSAPTAGLVTFYTPGSVFTRCYNSGTLISNFNVYTGGIAGSYKGTPGSSATPAATEFIDCYNTGAIVADGNQGGGIVAYATGSTYLTNCYNTANIEGKQMLGGIVSAFAGTGPQMVNCYNTGNITGTQGREGGLISWGSPTNGVVRGCWNSGNVASTSEEQKAAQASSYSIGGLAGTSGAQFTDCYNVGAVKGLACVGGLVGLSVKNTTMLTNCYNAGKVDAPADSCGSLIGNSLVDNPTKWTETNAIANCYYLNENSSDNDAAATGATALTRRQLAALDLGDGFSSPDNFTHPLVKEFADNPTALFYAAELVLADDDTPAAVTKSFNVGGTPTVAWTSDCAALAFDGSNATFTSSFVGPIKVTATLGDLSKTYDLEANVANSAIDDIAADAQVVAARCFNAAGIEVPMPAAPDGQTYIVVATLADGSVRTTKLLNK